MRPLLPLLPAALFAVLPGAALPQDRWQPAAPGGSYRIQLQGSLPPAPDADVFELDLFDTPQETIAAYHAAGARVICYFSAGSFEDWREDSGQFPQEVIGRPLGDWPGENWLNIADLAALLPVMETRIAMAAGKGCDAVNPDNIDVQTQDSGFAVSDDDAVAYVLALAEAAHARGLAIGLKNNLELAPALADTFDFAVNEECREYSECGVLSAFTALGKPAYAIDYSGAPLACSELRAAGLSGTLADYDLDSASSPCP